MREPTHVAASGLASVRNSIPGVLQPLLGGVFQLGGNDGGLGESERAGGAAQAVGVAAQLLDRRRVVAGRNQPFGELGNGPKLVARPLQVVVADAGW